MYIYIYKKLIDVLHNGDWISKISKIQVTSCQLQVQIYEFKFKILNFIS